MSNQIVSMSVSPQEEKSNLIVELDAEIAKQEDFVKSIRLTISSLKNIKKEYTKEIKALEKEANKKKKKDPNAAKRVNNGFSKPGPISEDLAKFMGKPKDFEISRTDVTKYITKYVKEFELTLPNNGRIFTFESKNHRSEAKKLKDLLKPNNDDEVTWFNLQKYLAPHYPKKNTTESAQTDTAPDTPAVVEKQEERIEPPKETVVTRPRVRARTPKRKNKV